MGVRTVFEINMDDLHIDDLIARIRIKSFFKAEQKRRLEYDRDVAKRVERGPNWVHSTWRNEHWQLSTMQLMARAFDYELGFEPMIPHGLWLKIDKAGLWQLSEVYASNPDADQRAEAARMDLCVYAGKIREALGIGATEFAKKLGTDTSKLIDWEKGNRPHYVLTAAQRHFRQLGAPLRFFLTGNVAIDGKKIAFDFPPCKEENSAAAGWLTRNTVHVEEGEDETVIFNALRPTEVVRFPAAVWREWIANGRD